MSTVTIEDGAEDPGAWRAALDPEGRSCAKCGQNRCAHSDLEYRGVRR